MSIVSAELTKISVNSYITMKISFTNQLRMIAERHPKADIHAILDAIGSDSRIGKKYLRAGLSYGGPCFPRDNRLLAYTARQVGLEAPLAEASDRVNERTKQELVEQVSEMARPGDTVAVLGVSYRPDTYITEEAAGLFLAQQLKRRGYQVLVHDFAATPANAPSLHEFELISNWEEFRSQSRCRSSLSFVVPGLNIRTCPRPQERRYSRHGKCESKSDGRRSVLLAIDAVHVQRMDHWHQSGCWARRSLVPLMILRWSGSRRSLANRGPQLFAPPTPTSLAKPGTILNSPGSWPDSIWCCPMGCRWFGRSTFVGPVLTTAFTVPISCDTRCRTRRGHGAIFFLAIPRSVLSVATHSDRLATGYRNCWLLSPPFRPLKEDDEASFADTINRAHPDFVWVALPGVRMERWIIENQSRYRGGVFFAVGDAFSLLSGRRSFAPRWMQRMGLTWAYRLSKEPLRLGPRYLRYNSMFGFYWLWDALRGRAGKKLG